MITVTSIRAALDDAPMRALHWKIFLFAALGIFIDGYDFFIIAAALPVITYAWNQPAVLTALIAAAATVGAVVGAAFLGRLVDLWGRRTLAMLTMTAFALFSIASGLAANAAILIALRFVLGMAIGADYPTGAAYVAEFMPLRRRPRLLFASLSFQALGAIGGALLGLALLKIQNVDAWRWMLAAGAVPAIVILILRRGLPESPQWLYARGRVDEARAVLSAIYDAPVALAIAAERTDAPPPVSAVLAPAYLPRTVLSCVPWFCMDVALYGMSLFTPIILAATAFAGTSGTFWTRDVAATEGAVFLDGILIVGFALGIVLIGSISAIRLQIAGFIGMIVGLALAALGATIAVPALIIAGFAIFNLCVNAGPNGTTYLIPALAYPTALRGTGHGLASACGKIGASFGIFVVPLMHAGWGLPATILVVTVFALAGLITTIALRSDTQRSAPLPATA